MGGYLKVNKQKQVRCTVNQFQNGEAKNSGVSWGMTLERRVAVNEDDDMPSGPRAFPYIALSKR